MINFLNMKYFLVVAEARSFSAAAKQLYISQQTLSAHIAQIEEEIGTQLFERTRPLTLTPAGERFHRGATEMLFLNTQMERELQDIVDPMRNSFRLGISHAYARALLPRLLGEFYKKYPQVDLQIFEMSYTEMDEALAAGKVDLIITRPTHCGANVKGVPLHEADDIYLFAPDSALQNVYGAQAPRVAALLAAGKGLTAVRDCPFILPRAGNVHLNALHLFLEAQIDPPVRIQTDTLETALALCRAGLGVTLSPGKLLGDQALNAQRTCYLLSRHRNEHALAVCYRETSHLSRSMQTFVEIAQRLYHADETQ